MRLDQLQLDLRPRPRWQAIDLGFALLRDNAGPVYLAWLALWVPLMGICYALSVVFPSLWYAALLAAWWLRPMLERVIILILSRAVFGERMPWLDALRAWPRQWGGGWIRLLTWWRPFMPGRGLFQPIWQLEGARGKFANERRRVLSRDGVGTSAYWFGIACAHFELILQFGLITFIGLFASKPNAVNPFLLLIGNRLDDPWLQRLLSFVTYGVAAGIIGPIYTAGCFTLYMNRRAELEAWDIELTFKQLADTAPKLKRAGAALGTTMAILLCMLVLSQAQPAHAKELQCAPPNAPAFHADPKRDATHGAAQTASRQRLDALYDTPELRGYECVQSWVRKPEPAKPLKIKDPDFSTWQLPVWVGDLIKLGLIAAALAVLVWLLLRYRDQLGFQRSPRIKPIPDAIAGLDIRPESLPNDIPTAVRDLWHAGRQRDAVALLYRATLSCLVHCYAVGLPAGATEGDCLHAAQQANYGGALSRDVLDIVQRTTRAWQTGAYAHQWLPTLELDTLCRDWQSCLAGGRP